jgi:hypothetical protein
MIFLAPLASGPSLSINNNPAEIMKPAKGIDSPCEVTIAPRRSIASGQFSNKDCQNSVVSAVVDKVSYPRILRVGRMSNRTSGPELADLDKIHLENESVCNMVVLSEQIISDVRCGSARSIQLQSIDDSNASGDYSSC